MARLKDRRMRLELENIWPQHQLNAGSSRADKGLQVDPVTNQLLWDCPIGRIPRNRHRHRHRHPARILTKILARMSVSLLVSMSWNAA